MLLTYSYPPSSSLLSRSPFFFLQLSHVTLAIPGKQLLSPVAWLNFQSDPSHSHGNLIIASYKLVPFYLRLHISTYNTHFTTQWEKKKRTWWVKEREVCKWCTCCLQVKYCVGVLNFMVMHLFIMLSVHVHLFAFLNKMMRWN